MLFAHGLDGEGLLSFGAPFLPGLRASLVSHGEAASLEHRENLQQIAKACFFLEKKNLFTLVFYSVCKVHEKPP